jgi:hypothetical protein
MRFGYLGLLIQNDAKVWRIGLQRFTWRLKYEDVRLRTGCVRFWYNRDAVVFILLLFAKFSLFFRTSFSSWFIEDFFSTFSPERKGGPKVQGGRDRSPVFSGTGCAPRHPTAQQSLVTGCNLHHIYSPS